MKPDGAVRETLTFGCGATVALGEIIAGCRLTEIQAHPDDVTLVKLENRSRGPCLFLTFAMTPDVALSAFVSFVEKEVAFQFAHASQRIIDQIRAAGPTRVLSHCLLPAWGDAEDGALTDPLSLSGEGRGEGVSMSSNSAGILDMPATPDPHLRDVIRETAQRHIRAIEAAAQDLLVVIEVENAPDDDAAIARQRIEEAVLWATRLFRRI